MTGKNPYEGKILRVDLSSGKISRERFYPQLLRKYVERLSMDNMGGWNFSCWDALLKGEGAFTHKNGKILHLTHGLGINEPQRVSPLT